MKPDNSGIRLNVSEDPSARAFHSYAFPVAIIEGNDPKQRNWILSNFIHLVYDGAADDSSRLCFYLFDYTINPHLQVIKADSEWINSLVKGDLCGFTHAQIMTGWYTYLNVDEFYIPQRPHTGQTHFSHDVLIHGSNDQSHTVDLLGYDDFVQFRSTRASWAQLNNAYESHLAMNLPWGNQFVLYRFLENTDYALNHTFIIAELSDFLGSKNPGRQHQALQAPGQGQHYGIEALHAYHRELVECRRGGHSFDLHSPQLLSEHVQLMNERISRLFAEQDEYRRDFDKHFATVVSFFRRLKIAILGATVRQDYSSIDRLIEDYPRYVDREVNLLREATGLAPTTRDPLIRPTSI